MSWTVKISDNDPESLGTGTHLVTVSMRVRNHLVQDFVRDVLPEWARLAAGPSQSRFELDIPQGGKMVGTALEAKRWVKLVTFSKEYWDILSEDQRAEVLRGELMSDAETSAEVTEVIEHTFTFEVFEPAVVDGIRLPLFLWGLEIDLDKHVVVRAEIMAYPSKDADGHP